MNTIKNIFLADDDEDDSFLFSEALKEINNTIILSISDNGSELNDKLRNTTIRPHLIFLDLNMPVMNGFECLDEIRATPAYDRVPIVMMSTSGSVNAITTSYQKGADLYIQKPSSYNDLKKAIYICLNKPWETSLRPAANDFFLHINN